MWKDRLRWIALLGLERTAMALERAPAPLVGLLHEAILHLSSPGDLSALTARAYDRNPRYSTAERTGLFGWERRLLEEFAPPSPARVLLGAAGGGRELSELVKLGYLVAAFEPGAALARIARGAAPPGVLACERASYEDLIAGLPAISEHAPFDLVILGWGSLSHLASDSVARDLLLTVRRLAPDAPLFASWVDDRPKEIELAWRSRFERLGTAPRPPRCGYSIRGGFSRCLSIEEISALAQAGGYRLTHYCEGRYPHAVLVPAEK